MRHNSVSYIVGFAAAICVICSLLVSASATFLKERQQENARLDKQKKVLGLVAALKDDYRKAKIGEAERAMLDFAVKLTRQPGSMRRDDVSRLRRAGFADAAILDIVQVMGYFAFVNRLADGLGVELEQHLR